MVQKTTAGANVATTNADLNSTQSIECVPTEADILNRVRLADPDLVLWRASLVQRLRYLGVDVPDVRLNSPTEEKLVLIVSATYLEGHDRDLARLDQLEEIAIKALYTNELPDLSAIADRIDHHPSAFNEIVPAILSMLESEAYRPKSDPDDLANWRSAMRRRRDLDSLHETDVEASQSKSDPLANAANEAEWRIPVILNKRIAETLALLLKEAVDPYIHAERDFYCRMRIEVSLFFLKNQPRLQELMSEPDKFPAWVSRSVPEEVEAKKNVPHTAPLVWDRDRSAGETVVRFIERVYGKWLGKGLTRAHLLALDKKLYYALTRHITKHGKSLPFELPDKRDVVDRELAEASDEDSLDKVRKLERLAASMRRRIAENRGRKKNRQNFFP